MRLIEKHTVCVALIFLVSILSMRLIGENLEYEEGDALVDALRTFYAYLCEGSECFYSPYLRIRYGCVLRIRISPDYGGGNCTRNTTVNIHQHYFSR